MEHMLRAAPLCSLFWRGGPTASRPESTIRAMHEHKCASCGAWPGPYYTTQITAPPYSITVTPGSISTIASGLTSGQLDTTTNTYVWNRGDGNWSYTSGNTGSGFTGTRSN